MTSHQTPNLSVPIVCFFTHEIIDLQATARRFTEEAVMLDEGREHHNRAIIAAWADVLQRVQQDGHRRYPSFRAARGIADQQFARCVPVSPWPQAMVQSRRPSDAHPRRPVAVGSAVVLD